MRVTHRLKLLVGLLLAVLLLALFLRSTDWGAVLVSMKNADPWLLALVCLGQVPLFFLRAFRWQCFLAPIKRVRIPPLMSSMMIGFMVSFIFPGRLGEIVRPVLLGIRERISKTSAFATVVLERICDMIAILVLMQLYFLLPGLAGPKVPGSETLLVTIRDAGLVALLGCLGVIAFIVLLKLKTDFATRLFGRLVRVLPEALRRKAIEMLNSFIAGLTVYHNFRTFLLIGLYSLLLWAGICSTIWICLRAFGVDVPYILMFPIQAILMIGVAIPTPGMVGGFHASMKIGLVGLAGVDPSQAVSATLVLHALLVTPVLLLGLFYAWREGFSITQIREMGEREKALEEA